MGIVQRITRLTESGMLTIQNSNGWFIILYKDGEIEIESYDPTLQGAIQIIESNLAAYNTRINIGNVDIWKR